MTRPGTAQGGEPDDDLRERERANSVAPHRHPHRAHGPVEVTGVEDLRGPGDDEEHRRRRVGHDEDRPHR